MERILTVSEINRYFKKLAESDYFLSNLSIKGEISNFKNHYTGHIYFTLKDEASAIKCVMFKNNVQGLLFEPKDGMSVVVTGRLTVFERDGTYQVYLNKIEQEGKGSLAQAFENLKQKLAQEGIFDKKFKKPLPPYPKRIVIVTSPTGAVIKDFISVATRRFPGINIYLYPVQVQGEVSSSQVVAALSDINKYINTDCIVIARGGGSMEDLWPFNSEELARAVFASKIPVVSAIGHETDFTICDFVADLRAPTPSAAAELMVPFKDELYSKIAFITDRMANSLTNRINKEHVRLSRIRERLFTKSPEKLVMNIRSMLNQKIAKLEAMNPYKVLYRGYSMAYNKETEMIIKSVNDLKKDDRIEILLSDGRAKCIVEEIKNEL